MSNLIQLKNQVKSIQATLKMTQAIRLVSMSMYSKLEKQRDSLRNYLERHKKMLNLLLNSSIENNHPLLTKTLEKTESKRLCILIATNKGLCGSLNTNLFRHFENTMANPEHYSFITIGQKAKKYAQENNLKDIVCNYNELNGENYKSLSNDLINRMVEPKNNFSSVVFYSNQLQGFFKQTPHATKVLPFTDNDYLAATSSTNNVDQELGNFDLASWTWEQTSEEIINFLLASYLKAHTSFILYDALLAEHAARFFAMDNSTTNANKLLEYSSLQYNKLRQTLITKEVAELSALNQ